MNILKGLDIQVFIDWFTTTEDCYKFLAELKWENGYNCRKCNSIAHTKGKQPCSRRCSKCGYDEFTTAAILFHKLKFDILKAFGMFYEISTSKKGANNIWLAKRFGLNQKTTRAFRQKVQLAMKSSEQYPLEDEVHVDEFEIGTSQKGEQEEVKAIRKSGL
ncbi:IS1595 family transposase [Aquimarina sp. 2201CG1-2-11]|uniref:transposase n=1 Tax=Aquimarina discodermiae TaxID=3231043 RepID=UPI003461DC11